MIIWGFGRQLRLFKKDVYEKACDYCGEQQAWQICVLTTWFTIFFIPIIPYSFSYRVECPNCKSYRKLTKEEYNILKNYTFEDNYTEESF